MYFTLQHLHYKAYVQLCKNLAVKHKLTIVQFTVQYSFSKYT